MEFENEIIKIIHSIITPYILKDALNMEEMPGEAAKLFVCDYSMFGLCSDSENPPLRKGETQYKAVAKDKNTVITPANRGEVFKRSGLSRLKFERFWKQLPSHSFKIFRSTNPPVKIVQHANGNILISAPIVEDMETVAAILSGIDSKIALKPVLMSEDIDWWIKLCEIRNDRFKFLSDDRQNVILVNTIRHMSGYDSIISICSDERLRYELRNRLKDAFCKMIKNSEGLSRLHQEAHLQLLSTPDPLVCLIEDK